MADPHNSGTRSFNMSRIRGKDTKPELIVRRMLHAAGFRFRLHRRDLPGSPDIVLPRHRAAVLIHGCFWHWHGCPMCRLPGTRMEFWREKLRKNVERDERNVGALCQDWRVCTVWECAVRGKVSLDHESLRSQILGFLTSTRSHAEVSGRWSEDEFPGHDALALDHSDNPVPSAAD